MNMEFNSKKFEWVRYTEDKDTAPPFSTLLLMAQILNRRTV